MVLDRCWPGGKAQNDVATAVLYGQRDLPDFRWLVRVIRDAVNLQEIDTPAGVLPKERVIPGLTGLVIFDSPARGIPGTRIILVRCILRFEIRTLDRRIAHHTLTRDAADDVNAELQSLSMDPVAELFETRVLAVLERRRKTRRHRNKSAFIVKRIFEQFRFGTILRIYHVPAFVNHGIRIPKRLQLRRQHINVVAELLFADTQPIGVPTVPSHRRSRRNHLLFRGAILLPCHRTQRAQDANCNEHRFDPVHCKKRFVGFHLTSIHWIALLRESNCFLGSVNFTGSLVSLQELRRYLRSRTENASLHENSCRATRANEQSVQRPRQELFDVLVSPTPGILRARKRSSNIDFVRTLKLTR